MKKVYLILFSIFLATNIYAQTVNDIPIEELEMEYIQIVGQAKFLSSKIKVKVDFGQQSDFFTGTNVAIKDVEGKTVSFNSMIDALNFMSASGYDFISSYVITVSNQNVYHYLLKKSK